MYFYLAMAGLFALYAADLLALTIVSAIARAHELAHLLRARSHRRKHKRGPGRHAAQQQHDKAGTDADAEAAKAKAAAAAAQLPDLKLKEISLEPEKQQQQGPAEPALEPGGCALAGCSRARPAFRPPRLPGTCTRGPRGLIRGLRARAPRHQGHPSRPPPTAARACCTRAARRACRATPPQLRGLQLLLAHHPCPGQPRAPAAPRHAQPRSPRAAGRARQE